MLACLPNVITYSALISAFEKGKHLDLALEVFASMEQHGVVPNGITYNAFSNACEKGQQPERVLRIFAAMER